MRWLILLIILLVCFPLVNASKQKCVLSDISDCINCNSYLLYNKSLNCVPFSSNLISDPSFILEDFGNKFRINIIDGNESASLILSRINDDGIDKPKLDVLLNVKSLDKIPSFVDVDLSKWAVYTSFTIIFLILVIISLILRDIYSPWRKHHHRKKHRK